MEPEATETENKTEPMDSKLIESKLIESELTFRNLRQPAEIFETKRSIMRWLALSMGVINPGETRLNAVPVLDAVFNFQFVQKKDPTVEEIIGYINNEWGQINEKTVRYHLLQLKKSNLISNEKGKYFLVESDGAGKHDETAWVNHYFDSEINPIKEKVIKAIQALKGR